MKKQLTAVLTIGIMIALSGATANAAFLTYTAVPLTAADGNGSDVNPEVLGLIQYTFFVNNDGPDDISDWAVDIRFSNDGPGSGIFNHYAFGGFVGIDTEAGGAGNVPAPPFFYSAAADSWLANGFSWLPAPITHALEGPPAPGGNFIPEAHITAAGPGLPGVEVPLVQLISDGPLMWQGAIARASEGQQSDTAGTTAQQGLDVDAGENDGPDKYSFGAHGDGKIGGGGTLYGFQLHGTASGPGEVIWTIFGPGLDPTGAPLPIDPDSPDLLNPIVTYHDLALIGARDRDPSNPYTVELSVDGTTDTATLHLPEPATMGLMLFGAIGVVARKRRRS